MQDHSTPRRPFPETPGIYRITCIVTGKFYIGSAVNLRKRQKDHRHLLNQGTHRNPKLQNAWRKYGKDAFSFDILELVLTPELLTAREQYWFNKLKPFDKNGYNIDRVAGSRYGSKQSKAAIEKRIATMKANPKPRTRMKPTPETIERLRISHRGKKPSYIPSSKGRTHRPESIEKMRRTKLGHTLSAEGRAKMIASKTGHIYAPEIYASRRKTIIVTSPDGIEYIVTGVRKFCEEHHLDTSSLMRVAKGKYSQHNGWMARFP